MRRQSLIERTKSFLNPLDFLLWLSEEFETSGWDHLEKEWAIPIGITLNLVFSIARANVNTGSRSYDDVFGDATEGLSWVGWLVCLTPY